MEASGLIRLIVRFRQRSDLILYFEKSNISYYTILKTDGYSNRNFEHFTILHRPKTEYNAVHVKIRVPA